MPRMIKRWMIASLVASVPTGRSDCHCHCGRQTAADDLHSRQSECRCRHRQSPRRHSARRPPNRPSQRRATMRATPPVRCSHSNFAGGDDVSFDLSNGPGAAVADADVAGGVVGRRFEAHGMRRARDRVVRWRRPRGLRRRPRCPLANRTATHYIHLEVRTDMEGEGKRRGGQAESFTDPTLPVQVSVWPRPREHRLKPRYGLMMTTGRNRMRFPPTA